MTEHPKSERTEPTKAAKQDIILSVAQLLMTKAPEDIPSAVPSLKSPMVIHQTMKKDEMMADQLADAKHTQAKKNEPARAEGKLLMRPGVAKSEHRLS